MNPSGPSSQVAWNFTKAGDFNKFTTENLQNT